MNERPWPLPSVAFRLSRTCFDLNRITAGFTGFYWVLLGFFLFKETMLHVATQSRNGIKSFQVFAVGGGRCCFPKSLC